MDFKKSLDAAMIPAAVLIAISVASSLIGAVPVLNVLLCILGLPLFVVNLAVLGWSGYRAVKEYSLDLVGGALTGGIAGFASALIGGIFSLILTFVGLSASAALTGDVGDAALGGVFGVIGLAMGVVFGTILGLVLGAVGAFVAGQKTEAKPPAKEKK